MDNIHQIIFKYKNTTINFTEKQRKFIRLPQNHSRGPRFTSNLRLYKLY